MHSEESSQRGIWSSKIAFIFVAAGSAIGPGNIWRFPMMVGNNGGAVFVIVYVLVVVLIGLPVMIAELSLGRHAQRNPVGAFERIKPRTPWKLNGYLGVLTSLLILSYICVIAGWAVGYFIKILSGTFTGEVTSQFTEKVFTEFASNQFQVFLFFILTIGITVYIVSKGIQGGIEKWVKALMPFLLVLLVFLAIYAISLPGAAKGLSFYLKPDFSKLNGSVVVHALGQAFFSLSLGMGIMITLGSYIGKSENLVSLAGWVCFSDTFIAILAGFIIFPTLFAIPGTSPGTGPGLVFQVLPLIFSKIPGGLIFGSLFFILLFIAAVTSTISLLEVPVSFAIDELKWSRTKASWLMGSLGFLFGTPSALSSGGMTLFTKIDFMGKIDFFFGNLALAISALVTCIFLVYVWKLKNAIKEIESGIKRFKLRSLWVFSIMILSPAAILIILYFIKTITGFSSFNQ